MTAFLPAPVRVGLDVFDAGTGEMLGVVVVDERPGLSASACRRCLWAAYDTAPHLAAGALARHLRTAHAMRGLGVQLDPLRRERRLGRRRFALAAGIDRAVGSEEAAA